MWCQPPQWSFNNRLLSGVVIKLLQHVWDENKLSLTCLRWWWSFCYLSETMMKLLWPWDDDKAFATCMRLRRNFYLLWDNDKLLRAVLDDNKASTKLSETTKLLAQAFCELFETLWAFAKWPRDEVRLLGFFILLFLLQSSFLSVYSSLIPSPCVFVSFGIMRRHYLHDS